MGWMCGQENFDFEEPTEFVELHLPRHKRQLVLSGSLSCQRDHEIAILSFHLIMQYMANVSYI